MATILRAPTRESSYPFSEPQSGRLEAGRSRVSGERPSAGTVYRQFYRNTHRARNVSCFKLLPPAWGGLCLVIFSTPEIRPRPAHSYHAGTESFPPHPSGLATPGLSLFFVSTLARHGNRQFSRSPIGARPAHGHPGQRRSSDAGHHSSTNPFRQEYPFETMLTPQPATGTQVVHPVIAKLVKRELIDVVNKERPDLSKTS